MENKKKRSWDLLIVAVLFCLVGILNLISFAGLISNGEVIDSFQNMIESSVNDVNSSFDQGYVEVMDDKSEWFVKLQELGNVEKYKERAGFWRAQIAEKGNIYLKINRPLQATWLIIVFVVGVSFLCAGFGLFSLKKWAIRMTFICLFLGFIYYLHLLAALYFPLDIIQSTAKAILELNILLDHVDSGAVEAIWPGKYPVLRYYLIGIPCIFANLFFVMLFIGARLYFRGERIRSQFE